MEERDHEPELPVATLRRRAGELAPGAWMRTTGGEVQRWARARGRGLLTGRYAPMLLTGVVFSAMMLAMGYVADRANRAGEAIDQMHRANLDWMQRDRMRAAAASPGTDPWVERHRCGGAVDADPFVADEVVEVDAVGPAALFYVVSPR